MRTITRTVIGGLVAALAVGAAALPAQAAPTPDSPSTMNKLVASTRAGVAGYQNVEAAIAAGYVQVGECTDSPEGAMGIHYMNPAYIHPGFVDPANPPFLTYGPSGDLWAAEFFEPEVGQPTPMYGSQAFDGPMAGHGPGMPTHYDLHVWVGKHNRAGMFAEWNPSLHC